MTFTPYRLPDGRVVPVDASAAKGALIIGFTLTGGRVVDAIRVDAPLRSVCAWHEATPRGEHVTHGICPTHAREFEAGR